MLKALTFEEIDDTRHDKTAAMPAKLKLVKKKKTKMKIKVKAPPSLEALKEAAGNKKRHSREEGKKGEGNSGEES